MWLWFNDIWLTVARQHEHCGQYFIQILVNSDWCICDIPVNHLSPAHFKPEKKEKEKMEILTHTLLLALWAVFMSLFKLFILLLIFTSSAGTSGLVSESHRQIRKLESIERLRTSVLFSQDSLTIR